MLTAIVLSYLPLMILFFTFIQLRLHLLVFITIVVMTVWLMFVPFLLVIIDELRKDKKKAKTGKKGSA
ncbi:hypothetical protein ACFO4N_00145 [Camelliibacillus cellulosilyticus]|uniref:Uncharacterized protein n=1 Tax=Camelliibacillus cellulosilyticus TaxID=2174486 RepID=A0ABV9GJ35_9BACL